MTQWHDRLRLVYTGALLAIAGASLVNGMMWVLLDEAGGGDLHMRWQEQQYVLRQQNPFDVHAAWRELDQQQEPQLAQSVLDPDLGLPTPGYPPWSYFTGIAFMWSADQMVVRVCFVLVNLVFLGCIAAWNFRLGGTRWHVGLGLMAASLTPDSICSTIALGQLGVIVVGSLIAAYWLDERGWPILAGLLVGVALIKPTLSFPFLLPFLIKQRWLTLVIAGAYTALGSVVVWALVQTDPVTMLVQMQTAAVDWGTIHYTGVADPIAILTWAGVPAKLALQLSPLICLSIAFVLMWNWRHASLMTLFAIAAVTARLWVSHFHYDDLIILFVLFGLAEVLVARFSTSSAIAYAVLVLVLLFPRFFHLGNMWDHISWRAGAAWECVLMLSQVGALLVLLLNSPRKPANPEKS